MTDIVAETPDFWTAHKVTALLATLALAECRCLPTRELVRRVTRASKTGDSDILLRQLRERTLEPEDVRFLVEAVEAWSTSIDAVSASTLRTIKRIVKLLPPADAAQIAGRFLNHRWKSGRDIAWEGYKGGSLPADSVGVILDQYARTGEQHLLELIARQPAAVAAPVARVLLERLEEPYWRGRAMAALLEVAPQEARDLSCRFPREYAHAVGRLRATPEVVHLVRLFDKNRRDFDFLNLYAYALGRLGHLSELQTLRHYAERILTMRLAEGPAQQPAPTDEAAPRG
jgi:hypothetical protein